MSSFFNIRKYCFLRALRSHEDTRNLFEVKSYLTNFEKGQKLRLYDIQKQLLKEEEWSNESLFTSPNNPSQMIIQKGQKYKSNNYLKPHKQALAAQQYQKKIYSQVGTDNQDNIKKIRDWKCFGCGSWTNTFLSFV